MVPCQGFCLSNKLLSRQQQSAFCHCQSTHASLKQKECVGGGGRQGMGEEREKMLCKVFFFPPFCPTLTKTFMWACTCMCVCVCGAASVHDHPAPLYEATLAGSGSGNVCTTTTHKHTHTHRQTNTVRSLRRAPRLDFAFFSVTPPSLTPLSAFLLFAVFLPVQ